MKPNDGSPETGDNEGNHGLQFGETQRTNHTGNSMEGRGTVTAYADSFGDGQELRIHFNRKP